MSRMDVEAREIMVNEITRLKAENAQLKRIGADSYKHTAAQVIEGIFHMLEDAKKGSNPDIIMLARLQNSLRSVTDSEFVELMMARAQAPNVVLPLGVNGGKNGQD